MAFRPIPFSPRPTAAPEQDYAYDINPNTIMKDPRFLKDARRFLADIGKGDTASWTDEEVIDAFYKNRTWANWNTVGLGRDMYGASGASDEPFRARLARMQKVYENAPSRGFWRGAQDIVPAVVADPLNLVGGAGGAKAAWNAIKGGASIGKAALAGARAGAIQEGLAGAGVGAVQNTMRQSADVDLGLQDEFSLTELGFETGFGGLGGAAAGGVFGAIPAAVGGRGMARDAETIAGAVGPDVLSAMSREQAGTAANAIREMGDQAPVFDPTVTAPDPTLTPEAASPDAPPPPEFDPATIRQGRQDAEDQLDRLRTEQASQQMIRQAQRNVARMQELEAYAGSIERFRQQRDALLAAGDPAKVAIGQKMAQRAAELEMTARALMRGDPNAATIAEATARRQTIDGDLYQPPEMQAGDVAGAADGAAPAATPEAPAAPAAAPAAPTGSPAPFELAPDPNAPVAADAPPKTRGKQRGKKAPAAEPTPAAGQTMEAATPPTGETQALDTPAIGDDGPDADALDYYMDTFSDLVGNDFFGAMMKKALTDDPKIDEATTAAAIARFERDYDTTGVPKTARQMVERTSMADQLKDYLGRLVRDKATAKGATPEQADMVAKSAVDNAMAKQDQTIANAGATPAEQVTGPINRSATGRAADALAEGPITAGRSDSGRAQAILKPGRATERDPITKEATRTITDGEVPTKRAITREEMELEAGRGVEAVTYQQAVRKKLISEIPEGVLPTDNYIQPKSPGIAQWVANEDMDGVIGARPFTRTTSRGRTKVIQGYVPKGTTVFYSPFTKKYYATPKLAMQASGLMPEDGRKLGARGLVRDATPEAPKVAVPTPEDVAEMAAKFMKGEVDLDTYTAYVKSAKAALDSVDPNPATVSRATTTTPAAPDGMRVAIRHKSKPSDVRVLSDAQIERGQGVEAMVGKKASLDDFDVGFVPDDARSGSRKAIDGFRTADDTEMATPEPGAAEPKEIGPKGIPQDEIGTISVDFSSWDGDLFDRFNNVLASLGLKRVARDEAGVTLKSLENLRGRLEAFGWPKNVSNLNRLVNALETIHEVEAKLAPDGIRLNSQNKEKATKAIETIFAGTDPAEVAMARDIIARLNTDNVPIFNPTANRNSFDPNTNVVNIGTRGQPVILPGRIGVLIHEVAHWSYENILTPADRVEFWKSMRKYIGDQGPNWEGIEARTPFVPENMRSNTLAGPQEFFANQFVGWVMRERFPTQFADQGFWQKVTRFIQNVFDRFFSKDFVDADLEPLFAKILPDEDAAAFSAVVPSGPHKKETTQFIVNYLNSLNSNLDDLKRALMSDNPDAAINAAREYAATLYRLSARNNTFSGMSSRTDQVTGAKDANVTMVTVARDLAKRIGKAINAKVDDDVVKMLDNPDGGFDQEAIDAADIWLRNNDTEGAQGKMSDPTAAIDALNAMMQGDKTSIEAVNYFLNTRLNYAYRRNEGVFLSPRELPNSVRPQWLPRENSAAAKASTQRIRRDRVAAKSADDKLVADAVARAKTMPAKRPQPDGVLPGVKTPAKSGRTVGVRDADLSDLLTRYGQTKQSKVKDEIAAEVLRRSKAETARPPKVEVSREVMAARKDAMEAMLRKAMDEADGPMIDQILYESWRRAEKKRAAGGRGFLETRMPLRYTETRRALDQERLDLEGDWENGVMPSARATIREIQSRVGHRDPEVDLTSKTLVYRALNMLGKTVRQTLNDANLMTVGDVHRLAGLETPPDAAAVFADFRGEAFNKLRADMRRMAIGLNKTGANPFDVMHEVHHLALRSGLFNDKDLRLIRDQFVEAARRGEPVAKSRLATYGEGKTVGELSPAQLDLVAEEWFAEQGALYAMGKVAKGDMFAIRESGNMAALTAKPRLVTMANRLIETVAYLVNGLIGRQDIKQLFRRIDGYGDMFAGKRTVLKTADGPGIIPEIATAHYGQVLKSMPRARMANILRFVDNGIGLDDDGLPAIFYHGTPQGDRLADPETAMMPGRGDFGRGIYVTRNPVIASEVYAQAATPIALRKRVDQLVADGKIKPEDEAVTKMWISHMLNNRREMVALSRERYRLANPDATPDNLRRGNVSGLSLSDVDEQLAYVRDYDQQLWKELNRLGFDIQPEVYATVVRARAPIDLRPTTTYEADGPVVRSLIHNMVDAGLLTTRGAEVFKTAVPDEISGADLHKLMIKHITREANATESPAEAADFINEMLGDMGYDSILTTHRNTRTFTTGEVVLHPTVVLLDHFDPQTGQRVAASQLIKSVESSTFDAEDIRFYYSKLAQAEAPNTDAIAAALSDLPLDREFTERLIQKMDQGGVPNDLAKTLADFARRRVPNGMNRAAIKKFGTAIFGANSSRLELNGMNALAKFHRDHFVDHAEQLAKRVYAFKNKLDALPDTPPAFKRWLANSNPIKRPDQPASHARIVKALRFGEGTAEFNRLSPQERDVARTISGLLRAELENMRKAGVIVGEIKDYFPQVWNPQAIAKDVDGFAAKLANYFEAEASRDGRQLSRADALERATFVATKLIDDEGHYVPPPVGSSRSAMSDNIDFQRLIRLDDPEFRANLSELNDYLENDLEAILIKYFDGTTRRTLQTQRFGVMNHGYFDYLRAVDEGRDGMAALLSTNRVTRKDLKTFDDNGYSVTLELRDDTQMPFTGQPGLAKAAVDETIRVFREQGEVAAKQFLMDLNPNPPGGPRAPVVSPYEHRVNAIIDAIRDFGGEPRPVPAQEIVFAQDALRLAMKKQVEGGPLGSPAMRDFSRGLRTFNAVSLLSFTVLTSLPDLVMPMIRSGSAKAHIKALRNFAKDPHYRQMIRNTGVAIESIAHRRMAGLFGADISGKIGQLNNAFFNATLLTPWTDMNREIAGSVGFEAFRADISRAIELRVGDGSDINAQKPEYRRIARRLNRYGLGKYLEGNEAIDLQTLDSDPTLARAVVKFANDAIFSPTPDDMPLWTNTPVGSIIWQLKSYPTMLMRFAKDVLVDDVRQFVKTKDAAYLKRPGLFLTLGPLMGAGALAVKDIAQFRGGEEQDEAELRHRNAAKFWGYDEKVHGDADTFGGWYLEGLMAMGGFGLLTDILHATTANADNGAYGFQRWASALFGPSVGTMASGYEVLGGLMDNQASNAEERSAVREAVRRVPILGGTGIVSEGVTDMLAGEAGARTESEDDPFLDLVQGEADPFATDEEL